MITLEQKFLVKFKLEAYFIFGESNSTKMLKNEIDVFDDIIIGDFQDSYLNLTLKTLAMFRWFETPKFSRMCSSLEWTITQETGFATQKNKSKVYCIYYSTRIISNLLVG